MGVVIVHIFALINSTSTSVWWVPDTRPDNFWQCNGGNRSKPDPTHQAWFVAAIKGRREEKGSTSGGKGRTTPLRGGRFWTLIVLRGQTFPFWQKVKVTFSQKVNFYASLLVMKFYCQSVIRYHVTRAEAETCYGCLRVGIKKYKKRFVFWEGLGRYKINVLIIQKQPEDISG